MTAEELARRAGLEFADLSLLRRALTHRSYINEHPEALEDNERLEFLGDATLDFLTGAWLYNRFPEMDEGSLTRLRSALVRTEQLAEFAEEIQLGEALRLGRGEEVTGGRERPALLCGAFEALIGALYLDSGLEAVSRFIEPRLERGAMVVLENERLIDARSILQMWSQAEMSITPRYRTISSSGPDHERVFLVEVSVGDRVKARGKGRSKQLAAQEAASKAMYELGIEGL